MTNWKEVKLESIADVIMGQSPKSEYYNAVGDGLPFLQGNRTFGLKYPIFDTYTTFPTKIAQPQDVIMSVRAPVGDLNITPVKMCLGRGVCAIIPHEENMSDFIYQYLTFYKFMWRKYEQGSTFTSINGSDVRNIFCPKVRNVSILTLVDIKINIEERVVKQYQSQKQYMLYQMFI